MSRSVWKGPFVEESLIKKVEKQKNNTNKKPIKIWSRKSTIIPDFVGFSFLIYNGKKFIPLTISEDMVGHKFGEFAPTRQFFGHTPADKKAKIETEEVYADWRDVEKITKVVRDIIILEKESDVYVNLASGSKIHAIAMDRACMTFDDKMRANIHPFYAEAKSYFGFKYPKVLSKGIKNTKIIFFRFYFDSILSHITFCIFSGKIEVNK